MIADILVSGVPLGCLYALVAVSYNILYRPTNVFNFAQGDLVTIGALLTASFLNRSLVWPLALLAAAAIVGAIALLEEVVAVSPILRRSPGGGAWVITTLAFSLILTNLVGKYWGMDPVFVSAPWPLSADPFTIHGVQISSYQIALVAISAAIVLAVEALYRTRTGKAIMAVAENRDAALLRGVDPSALSRWSFIAGGALAAATGYLAAPLIPASPALGVALLVKGFAAAALGGLGNNKGALIAGLIIGVTEATGSAYFTAGYQQTIILVVVLAILLIRPQGLFGAAGARVV
ncbi:MAG: branched-chain amino acid ABC transporter permease [Roseiarcus sp.]|jgi:branched-chain amino acid transport system permease protein